MCFSGDLVSFLVCAHKFAALAFRQFSDQNFEKKFVVYYESMKRKLLKPIYECRCNGRLQPNAVRHLRARTHLKKDSHFFSLFFPFHLVPHYLPMARSGLRRFPLYSGILLALLLLAAPLASGESRDNEEKNKELLNNNGEEERIVECVAMQDEYKVEPRVSWGMAIDNTQVSLRIY